MCVIITENLLKNQTGILVWEGGFAERTNERRWCDHSARAYPKISISVFPNTALKLVIARGTKQSRCIRERLPQSKRPRNDDQIRGSLCFITEIECSCIVIKRLNRSLGLLSLWKYIKMLDFFKGGDGLVKIRLTRLGAHKRPFYRVIVADSRARRNGPFIEILGTYDPLKEPSEIIIDLEKAKLWLQQGAQPTDTVKKLMQRAGM